MFNKILAALAANDADGAIQSPTGELSARRARE